ELRHAVDRTPGWASRTVGDSGQAGPPDARPWPHEATMEHARDRPRGLASHVFARELPRALRAKPAPLEPRTAPRVADERLRLLHRHALEGPARPRRDRAAPLRSRCVA